MWSKSNIAIKITDLLQWQWRSLALLHGNCISPGKGNARGWFLQCLGLPSVSSSWLLPASGCSSEIPGSVCKGRVRVTASGAGFGGWGPQTERLLFRVCLLYCLTFLTICIFLVKSIKLKRNPLAANEPWAMPACSLLPSPNFLNRTHRSAKWPNKRKSGTDWAEGANILLSY